MDSDKMQRLRFARPYILLPIAVVLVVVAGLRWYAPLWQPAYAPVDPAPFFAQTDEGVDLNHATLQELAVLPGIGETRAKAIIAFRETNGPFASIEEVQQVKGIGPKTFEQIKGMIVTE